MKYFCFIIVFLTSLNGVSQSFVSKEYLLVDSLVISEIPKTDSSLIDSCLKAYHSIDDELKRLQTISYIVENCASDAVCKPYNEWIYKTLNEKLKGNITDIQRKEFELLLVGTLINIGYYYDYGGNIESALIFYHKGLTLAIKTGHKIGEGGAILNIGHVHLNQGDADKALEYFLQSLTVLEEVGDKYSMGASLLSIGYIYDQKGDLDSALIYYEKGLRVEQEVNSVEGVANAYYNIANLYVKQGKIVEAIEYQEKSLEMLEELGYKRGVASSAHGIGELFYGIKDYVKAKKYAIKSLEIAQDLGYPDNIKIASHLLSKIYKRQGKGMQALEMFKLYILMRDSINNIETQRISAQQEAKYEYEKQKSIDDAEHEKQKAIDDAGHDKLIAVEKEEKAKQKIITYTVAGGLAMVVVFLLFIFNRLRITKRQKLVIEEQKLEVEEQKEVVESAHQELEEKNQEIMDSIAYAKRIQSAILPPQKLVKEYLQNSFILYKPKDIVAGDFYWMEHVSSVITSEAKQSAYNGEIASDSLNHRNDVILFAAADCTGHGVPGAMVSVVCNNALNRSVREYGLTDPGEILDKTREIVIQEFEKSEDEVKDGMDIALCSLNGNVLQYAGAHNPLWLIRNEKVIETKANKQPIGKFDKQTPYTTHTFELQRGDSFYIFSDGFVDQFGGDRGKKFKAKAFRELLLSIQSKSMEEQKEFIDNSFETWRGDLEQIDDVCVIGVKI